MNPDFISIFIKQSKRPNSYQLQCVYTLDCTLIAQGSKI